MITIKLPKLHIAQLEIWNGLKRFTIVIAGRRFGKTLLGLLIILYWALSDKGVYWWISPNYPIGNIAWRKAKNLVSKIPFKDINIVDRTITLPNKSIIVFKSADRPNSLRGEGLKGAVLDEVAFMEEEVWNQSIRPALVDKNGKALFLTTPKGKNWIYRLYLEAQNKEDWITFQKPTSDNPYIPKEEIELARKTTPFYIFQQEYLAQFIDNATSIFRNINTEAKETNPKEHVGHDIYLGVDLAKQADFTVITAICKTCNEQLFIDRSNNLEYLFQEKRIEAHVDRWKPKGIVVETNNIGIPFIEGLKRKGLSIIEFTTTAHSKPNLIEDLAIAIEMGQLKLLDNKLQLNELGAFGFTMNKLGLRSYEATAGHDDIVMALALAYYGTKHRKDIFLGSL